MSIEISHPVPGASETGGFRWREAFTENGVYVPAMLHNGQDYGAPEGTPILAAHDGTVIWTGVDRDGGNGIQIEHPDGWSTLYFHMNAPTWRKVGDRVKRGKSVIGHVGMSGLATGNHLHFMLRIKGADVDPISYLTASPKPKPKPAPVVPEEEEEIMELRQIHCIENGKTLRALHVPGTSYFIPWTEAGATYANRFAKTWETGSSVEVTPSLYRAIQSAAATLLPAGRVQVEMVEAPEA